MFLEEEAPDERDRERQLEAENASLQEQLTALRKELAAKTVELSKREQAWAQERAAQVAAAATPDKDAHIAALENNVKQLEAALVERTEELESSMRLQNHYKQRAKEALAAAAEREADGVAEREDSRSAATAVAEQELELLSQELQRVRARAAVEADVARRDVAEMRARLAAAAEERDKAVQDALAAGAEQWQMKLDEAQREAEEQVSELQDEVVRLRTAAEASLRSAADDHFAAELSSLNKAKIQVQRECEALRDMAAQAAAQHRDEITRYMQENAALKARIAADAAAAAMGGRVLPPRSGKTFGALQFEGPGGAFERLLVSLEQRRKGLVALLAVSAVVVLLMMITITRAALSAKGGGLCFLEKLGVTIGPGCQQRASAAAVAAIQQEGSKLADLLSSPLPRHKDVASTEIGSSIRSLFMWGSGHSGSSSGGHTGGTGGGGSGTGSWGDAGSMFALGGS